MQTGFPRIRTNVVVGIAYEADMSQARKVALDAVQGVEGLPPSPRGAVGGAGGLDR